MILTVTLNTMLDKTIYVDHLRRGKIHRSERLEMVAGGKGINVSRQLVKLGKPTVATGFIGGETGNIISGLMSDEGIDHDFVRIRSMTREGVTYRESDNSVTSVFEPPHTIYGDEPVLLIEKCRQLLTRCNWVVCCGSSPNPAADGIFRDVILEAVQNGKKTVLDSYGEPLRSAVSERPFLIKANLQEFESTFGITIAGESNIRSVLNDYLEMGINTVIVTNGPENIYAASSEAHWLITPPTIKAVNPTGSGDAFIAGFIYATENGLDFEECLRFAAASGTANAATWKVAASSYDDIECLTGKVEIRKL